MVSLPISDSTGETYEKACFSRGKTLNYPYNPMKTQKKNYQGLYLQKRNNRWKWMAGATAATAAGVTASQASTITVNLFGNYISAYGGNHLNADLTGDGHPDLTIAGASFFHRLYYIGSTAFFRDGARATLNGVVAYGFAFGDGGPIGEILGSKTADVRYAGGPSTLTGSIPIFFKDLHINGGAPTKGSLEVTVSSRDPHVQLDSFTYTSNTLDQASSRTLPDQGSSLALLAMGAGGILALRRWRAAQGRA